MPHTALHAARSHPTRRAAHVIALVSIVAATLAGCAAPAPSTGTDHADSPFSHVHSIVADPAGDGFLLATHEGIHPATPDGEIGTPVGGHDFDAMGLTDVDGTLIASGHPGPRTDERLGAPHLGIIRSTDNALTWEPVAFIGEKDFHALTAGPDGTLYGVPTDSTQLLTSNDKGQTWVAAGEPAAALGLVVDATGRLIVSTPDGLQTSSDGGKTFTAWSGAPRLFGLSASPDHQRLVGLGSGGTLWTLTAGGTQWTQAGTVHGAAMAVTVTNSGDMLVADDSGLTRLPTP